MADPLTCPIFIYWFLAMLVLAGQLSLLVVVSRTAQRLGRNVPGWIIVAIVVSPIVAGLMLLLLETPSGRIAEDTKQALKEVSKEVRSRTHSLEELIRQRTTLPSNDIIEDPDL